LELGTKNLELGTKMPLQVDSYKFFHLASTDIDEKLHNDSIWIIPPHLGRLFIPKIFTKWGEKKFPLPSP